VTGNLTGFVFLAVPILVIWIRHPDRIILHSFAAGMVLLGLYTYLVAPPLIFTRILAKAVATVIIFTDESATGGRTELLGKTIEESLKASGKFRNLIARAIKVVPGPDISGIAVGTADRWVHYEDALGRFASRPVIGHGYGNLSYGVDNHPHPHNQILELLAEGGAIAAVLGAYIFIASGLSAWRLASGSVGDRFAFGFFTLLGFQAMVSGYWGSRLLLFAIGLILGANCRRQSMAHHYHGK
jgi:O-Antigen ligase